MLLLAILTPACVSSSLAFCMMHSAYKSNKQGENIQAWHTPFPILNLESVAPGMVLTVAFDLHKSFSGGQVRWSGISISLRISTMCCDPHRQIFRVVIEAEVDVLLEFSCFSYDPTDVGSLIFGSLPFLNPACTSGISQFMHCWSRVWRILSKTLLACEIASHTSALLTVYNTYVYKIFCNTLYMHACLCIYVYVYKYVPIYHKESQYHHY